MTIIYNFLFQQRLRNMILLWICTITII